MKIKKFTAANMPEAMKQIRLELGSDAVILNSRVVQSGGVLGFFRKSKIEVIAAIDHEVDARKLTQEKAIPSQTVKKPEPMPLPKSNELQNIQDSINKVSLADPLRKEITSLKDLLKKTGVEKTGSIPLPEPIQKYVEVLNHQEVDNEIIKELMSVILEKWYLGSASAEQKEIQKWFEDELTEIMSIHSFGGLSFNKKFVNVIGPTGVGKTTTLAKIAAECVLKHKKKVAFITTDTYRIAAIEQLKTYAKILNVPLEVCYNLEDFRKSKELFSDYDLVFIDTAGRNFRNEKYVADLKEMIDFNKEMETFLVLALTAKQRDMEEIRKQFSVIPINKFIFTKADETASYGAMVNMCTKFSTGIAYVTNGQDVPDDLVMASPHFVAKAILGVGKHE